MSKEGKLPSYLADAFGDLYAEDGLLCLGKGLQWLALLGAMVRFYSDTSEDGHAALLADDEEEFYRKENRVPPSRDILIRNNTPRVFVLGLRDSERLTLRDMLQNWGTPESSLPLHITNESGGADDRKIMYQSANIVCVTSRIFIVDMLSAVVSATDIDGILVAHAEAVTEQSTEAFIIRIFQSQLCQLSGNRKHFIKAFSDSPEQLVSGFGQLEKILKALYVTKLYIYPRFHNSIRNELEDNNTIHVTEFHQPLSNLQKDIQNSIAAAVIKSFRQLRSSVEHLLIEAWDSELTVDNCVTNHFDRAITKVLEPVWHRLSPQTRQLVTDLKTLRTLFNALLSFDCVSFWGLLNSIQSMSTASRYPAMWLLDPSADVIYKKAKERVYRLAKPIHFGRDENSQENSLVLHAVLEENPKWKLLKEVLQEIIETHCQQNDESETEGDGPINLLIMVKDEKTVESIKSFLTVGNRTIMLRWLRYLELQNDRSRAVSGAKGTVSVLQEESRLLLEEEGRVRRTLFGNAGNRRGKGRHHLPIEISEGRATNKRKAKLLNEVPAYVRKRRRLATEKNRGGYQTGDDIERMGILEDAIGKMEHEFLMNTLDQDLSAKESGGNMESSPTQVKRKSKINDGTESHVCGSLECVECSDDINLFGASYPNNQIRIIVKSYSSLEGEQELLFLQDVAPKNVIFYDSDVSFVRALEVYAAIKLATAASNRVAVHASFLTFEASAEEKSFKKALEREQTSFEKLIQNKQSMAPPMLSNPVMTQEMIAATVNGNGSIGGTYMGGALPLAFDTTSTRRGRGKFSIDKVRRDIVVDVREFRSALPSILHLNGMRLAPVTLTVGDFVLTNVHCIERKSISDLFGSFASGRLYTQAEAMSKYYKCPSLLIEFDPNKSFCLQNQRDLGTEIRTDAVCTKMALLTLHFPKLRILWSRSPHETYKIFRELKTNHDEPDVDRAIEAGRNDALDDDLFYDPSNRPVGNDSALPKGQTNVDEGREDDDVNEVARDMLLRLPGVTTRSARRILQQVDTLAQLTQLSKDDLRSIAGPSVGLKLYNFFTQKISNAKAST
jgi:DNA excision repair protein ERCC-4